MAKNETQKQDAQSTAGQGGASQTEEKADRKRTGAAKRSARRRYGDPVELQSIDAPTAAKSAELQESNGRAAMAAGRKERAAAEINVEAYPLIKTVCTKNATQLTVRGLAPQAVHGAGILCERLSVAVEVAALSVASTAASVPLDDAAFISKRRDAILRVLPGLGNTPVRAKFGLHVPMKVGLASSVRAAALALLAGKKALPGSRASRLLSADDEKRLKAIAKKVQSASSQSKSARAEGVARTTERDILNTALELFYDDYAASIGLVLENDEVARVQALELIPRRAEQREKSKDDGSAPASGSEGAADSMSASAALVKA